MNGLKHHLTHEGPVEAFEFLLEHRAKVRSYAYNRLIFRNAERDNERTIVFFIFKKSKSELYKDMLD